MDSLLLQAENLGVESLLLTVVSENKVAINLYEKYGFTKYAIDKKAIKISDEISLDKILMVKDVILDKGYGKS